MTWKRFFCGLVGHSTVIVEVEDGPARNVRVLPMNDGLVYCRRCGHRFKWATRRIISAHPNCQCKLPLVRES